MKKNFSVMVALLLAQLLAGQSKPAAFMLSKQQTQKAFGPAAVFIDSIFLRMNAISKKTGKKLLVKNNPSFYKDNFFAKKNLDFYYLMIGRSYLATLDKGRFLRAVDSFAQNIRYADIETALARSKNKNKDGFYISSDSATVVKPYYDSLVQEFCGKIFYFGQPALYSQVDKGVNFCEHLKEMILMQTKEPAALRKEEQP